MPILSTAASAMVLAHILTGCAGDGGGGTMTAPSTPIIPVVPTITPPAVTLPPAAVTAADFRTPEYRRMGALESIHAAEAYAQGYTGAGVIIGIVDFNFNFSSNDVRYSADSRGPSAVAQSLYRIQTGEAPSTDPHGHAVASIAAAIKNDIATHGVAFDATVLGVDYFADVNETQETHGFTRYHVADPWTYITSHGGRIINTSYGYDASDGGGHGPTFLREAYVNEDPVQAVANGALLVVSAGNKSGANPITSVMDTLDDIRSANLQNGPGAYIIAGALTPGLQMASYSSRAGIAKDYYMVAVADDIVAPWTDGALYILSGTSFAAPQISGAAAIVLQKWPMLTAKQVADILFASATDLGAPGVDEIYGHGLLNVNAALQPIGTVSVATASAAPTTAGSPLSPVAGTGLVLGQAFGDAPALHASLTGVMILDGFDRDFRYDLSPLAWSKPSGLHLAELMRERFGWQAASLALGDRTGLSFDLRDDPWSGLQTLGGSDGAHHRAAVQFFGQGGGIDWTAGTGVYLSDALAGPGSPSRFSVSPLTRAFSPILDASPMGVAAMRVALSRDTALSLGLSQASDESGVLSPVAGLRKASPVHAAALRLDHTEGASLFAVEWGAATEDGGLLGSHSVGGLRLTESSTTIWTTASAETDLDAHWSLKAAFAVAETGAAPAGGSLVAAIAPILSTSISLGVAGRELLTPGDTLSFTVHQPLRAERADVTLLAGTGRDPTSGTIFFTPVVTSLVPSGREVAFESSYRVKLGAWSAEANLAYRRDAGNIAGRNETDAMLFVSRKF